MKRSGLSRTIVAIAMMLIGWLPSLAHDLEVDGVFYNKTSDNTVAVTYKGNSYLSYSNEYSGNVVIPSSVNYYGTTYSVTSIGIGAFRDCSSLTGIEIPNSVTSIRSVAFDGCESLRSIEIPNSVTSIGNDAFEFCTSLTSIVVDAGNTKYDSRNGCNAIIETASNTLIAGCQNTIIPNSVTSIGSWAFRGCSSLTSVEIPNSVTSIGSRAFEGCSSLTSVEIPNSVTSIGSIAFYNCTSLTNIKIPNSVTSIGKSAFSGCSSLTSIEIPNSVTSIEGNAFYGCSSLTSIVVDAGNTKYDSRNECNAIIETASNTLIAGCQNTIILNSVTSIGDSAFSGCSSLTSIQIPNSVTSIGDSAFSGCSSLTSIQIPNSVTSIGEYAFRYCDGLTSIQIPDSVTSIGGGAFQFCKSLTSVEIGNSVTSIGNYAFGGYTSLTKITCLATTPTVIEPNTFSYYNADLYVPAGCKEAYEATEYWNKFTNIIEIGIGTTFRKEGLNYIIIKEEQEVAVAQYDSNNNNINKYSGDIVIPSSVDYNGITYSVTSIEGNAFRSCSSLTSIEIPNSVTSIGNYAFRSCSGLTSIEIPNSVTSIGNEAFYNCTSLTSVKIGNSVTSIGDDAFYECSSLTSIEIPNSVTSIGEEAFRYCSGLTDVVIGNSVTSIGDWAFCETGLTSVEIPNSVSQIGIAAFSFNNNLSHISVESGNPVYDSRENCNAIIETSSNKLIAGCNNSKILNSIITIGDRSFIGCNGITFIAIPNTVTNIEFAAFAYCENLTTIEIPNSVIEIGESVFESCKSLTTIEIPNSVIEIGERVFENCKSLTTIEIPNSVTEIKYRLFYGCGNLTNVVIPNSVNTIGRYAFAECYSLTSIVIPNSVTSIGLAAFERCSSLTSIQIPNSVTSIGRSAFSGCSGLTSIEIPNSVTSIGIQAFRGCNNLTKITCLVTTPPTIQSVTFSNYSAELYVPAGCISAYQSADYWKNFNIKEIVILSTSIALNQTTATLKATETLTLVATVLPENATDKSVTWKSSNEAVATVDANGLVTAIAVGEATITATTADGSNKSATCKITVAKTLAESVALDKTTATLKATETLTLKATVAPATTADKSVTWKSSNEAVATVDANGKVTAVAVGEATITATTADGSNRSATCVVIVKPTLATSITLDYTEYEMVEKSEFQLTATILPESTTNKGVVWSSSDMWIASVDANGLVRAYSVGEAIITATTVDGSNLSATCKVTVVSSLAQSITLDKTEVSLKATETATLVATVLPETTSNKGVEWKSSDESVAIVSKKGVITAIAVGEATITATTADGSNLSASCTVTVVPTPGDVNNDASVNVTDIVTVASYIVGKTTDVFIFEAADMTKDGSINIVDIVAIANIILSDSSESNVLAQRCAPNTSDAIKIEDFAAGKNQSQQVAIEMTNASDYSAFQMDIRLPKGMSIAECELASAATDHMVAYRELPDGAVRVLVYSLTCRTLPDSEEGIISLRTTTDSRFEGGEIVVENILFADRGQNEYRLYDSVANVNLATGVSATDMDCVVYAENQSIVIISPCDQQATISSVDGVSRTYTLNEGRNEIKDCKRGIYIIETLNRINKLIIK